MAVVPASMAESIIILDDDDDDDEEEKPRPSLSAATSSCQNPANHILQLNTQQLTPTHIPRLPFDSSRDRHVLQEENKRLFTEFVEYCTPLTQDCPEVLTFLHTKHSKARPDFLSSVEFRNTLGRCLTRAQANRSKTFVYINDLCTTLRQHAAKRRLALTKSQLRPCTSASPMTLSPRPRASTSTSVSLKCKEQEGKGLKKEEVSIAEDEQPSTSGLQEDRDERQEAKNEDAEKVKKANRAFKRQVAYLENLLKVYNEEICRLQEKDLSLDDLEAEDSGYIQEHQLKRKMMKIYDKLCELKGCSTLTGRVIEQRIPFSSTRYPEINKRIERFINSPEAHHNPPDYSDILQQVLRINERSNLSLSRRQVNQIAEEIFSETGSRIQERRHLDLVYNFGSHLTDSYNAAMDPALLDTSLNRKLRTNREVALSSLEEVINRYASKQEDTEELERTKRLGRDRLEKERSQKHGDESKENGKVKEKPEQDDEEDDDDEEEEDELSSDPDIEEEIQASKQQAGPDDSDEEEDDSNEAEQANMENGTEPPQTTDVEGGGVQTDKEGEKEPVTSGLGVTTAPGFSPLSETPSPRDSPSQSQSIDNDKEEHSPGRDLAGNEEAVASDYKPTVLMSMTKLTQCATDASPVAANHVSLPQSPAMIPANDDFMAVTCDTQSANGRSLPPSSRDTRNRKRKKEDMTPEKPDDIKQTIIHDSDVDIPFDMGVMSSSPPLQVESTRADTPTQDLVTSSLSCPPAKKNMVVNVATQCEPDEIIELSDSD